MAGAAGAAGAAGVVWATAAKLHNAAESESMNFFIGIIKNERMKLWFKLNYPQMKTE